MRKISLTILLLLAGLALFGQLSEGGFPRQVNMLKSAASAAISMPDVNNDILRWASEQKTGDESLLKPLRFAHAFEVEIQPFADGEWYRADDGWYVWQVKIYSESAYSLNLIFEDFSMGASDLLFLFTPGRDYVLGAFTAQNVTVEGIFAVSPVPGNEVVVQYETPEMPDSRNIPFVISRVNHDFKDILKYNEIRRPLGVTAQSCISNVNCLIGNRWRDEQNSVCRVMIEGVEFCTGTLMNNTAQNQRPFVLTANHCISTDRKAASSLFLFNYESPYCGSLDGDISHSISGSTLCATLDSLDFALVEMTVKPPPSFRPYYAGWNNSGYMTDSAACIQHPQGDIKKIALDVDKPSVSNFGNYRQYTERGFLRIAIWDDGATQPGSSGGPLLNRKGQVIGSLVGGDSSCSYTRNDYFSRFDMAWNHSANVKRQLKNWLDPFETGVTMQNGKNFNKEEDLCCTYTNLNDGDSHLLLVLESQNKNAGYWAGTNSVGISEVGDKFLLTGKEILHGVSVGVGMSHMEDKNSDSKVNIKVYNIDNDNYSVIHTQQVALSYFVANAMNLVIFDRKIVPSKNFLISIDFSQLAANDSIAVFQSFRDANSSNSMFLRMNNDWVSFPDFNSSRRGGVLALELIACNIDAGLVDSISLDDAWNLKLYPNPVGSEGKIKIVSNEFVRTEMISLYNIHGQRINLKVVSSSLNEIEIDMSGKPSGVYIIKAISDKGKHFTGKFLMISP
ncbi:MAG: trypsin-like peptidase domain-containing protein [Prolixibacteraceae bacterium]|nr:trypsin-like peptidase domain-containing protein [Prolixibacteraceae bacterium]